MPELPEVEVASRQLRSWLGGKRITAARAEKTRVTRGQPPGRFASLAGHSLQTIERRGKWMLLSFDGGEGLASHLGMTGKWMRRKAGEAPPSHVRASIELEDGHVIDYRDPRLFGVLVRGTTQQLRGLTPWRALGPDPLAGIDVDRLHGVLSRTKRSLKEALMDQRTLAGLGNIQVAESLHRARLDPRRAGRTMRQEETERLAQAIHAALRATLASEDGPDPITYVEEGGENDFLVYDREGQPCTTCGGAIERIVQGGRSTFWCPECQRSGSRVRPARRTRRASKRKPARQKPPRAARRGRRRLPGRRAR